MALFSKRRAALATFEVFSKVRKGRVLPQQLSYLEDAKDQVLEIENHTIQTYQWSGKRETILLVHGWESNTFRWRNLIAKLKDADYNIIAFDAPGTDIHQETTYTYLCIPTVFKPLLRNTGLLT